ncbi:MAG: hypothetical protein RLZZ436_1903 [Planctomycetota bacterium]|jgi:hypothetical protein
MKRIFLTLAVLAHFSMVAAMVLGLQVGDPMTLGGRDPVVNARIGSHILIGLGALTGITMVHALVFTWFMGTGRWIEESSRAYGLSDVFHRRSQKLKYSVLPGILLSFLLVLATGCLGAIADPASAASLQPMTGISDSAIHFTSALITWLANLLINLLQYLRIAGNSAVVEGVLAEVRRIRVERGLPVA